MNKKFLTTLFFLLLFTSKSLGVEFIGVIGAAVGEINNQKNEKLSNGSKIYYGDTINVNSNSNAQILFLDETVMTVGENTELTIDDFVYDPQTNNGNFVTNIKSGIVKTISGKISEKNPENLKVKMPNGSLGVRGTEFLVSSNSNNNESTVVLLGPGPENTLGMIPGNIQLTDGLNTTEITNPGFQAMITNVVSLSSPTNAEVISQMSSSMSHSVLNARSIVDSSKNLTTNLINSADLKTNIIVTAEKFDLKSDESASEILSSLSTESDSKEISVAMNQLQENIVVTDNENYVRTLDQDTILYDSGWFDLTPVETGSNGLTYSLGDEGVSQVFDTGATQQGRAKVYVNFNKKEISADVFSKLTLKGASTVDYSFTTPTVTLTTIPVVASVPKALVPDGTTSPDELIDSGGGECPADSCTSLVRVANTLQSSAVSKQALMDLYNHDTSNSDAAKEVFQYGKFTTVDGSGLTGLGTFVFEGAHDATAAPAGEAAYVQSIERLEGSTVVVGKALE
tara:strand:- start:56 stop:1591 length:1536 start_codon:yes stop_codon:yes gene_type:complete